jgi:hypothetical protein
LRNSHRLAEVFLMKSMPDAIALHTIVSTAHEDVDAGWGLYQIVVGHV